MAAVTPRTPEIPFPGAHSEAAPVESHSLTLGVWVGR